MIKQFYLTLHGSLTDIKTTDQSEPGSNDKEDLIYIPQSSKTKASLSDVLALYPSAEVQLAYSTVRTGWRYKNVRFNFIYILDF